MPSITILQKSRRAASARNAAKRPCTAETFSEAAGSTNTADTSDARDLTTAELQKFTDWINEGDNGGNYGFLLSDYRDPKDADLGEIFYSGAGMATEPLTAAERQEYLKISGREDIETDCVRLTTEQINRVLTKRLGCTLDEMSRGAAVVLSGEGKGLGHGAWRHELCKLHLRQRT